MYHIHANEFLSHASGSVIAKIAMSHSNLDSNYRLFLEIQAKYQDGGKGEGKLGTRGDGECEVAIFSAKRWDRWSRNT